MKRLEGAINEQYPLTLWIKYYTEGKFDNPDFDTQVDAGWYDWFCSTSSLAKKLKSLAGKVKDMSRSKLIDPSKCYVFFQNNCPIVGPTYDVFAICDIETERVIYAISKMKRGVYGKDFSGWSIYVTDEVEYYDFDTWKEAKAFLKID